MWCIGANWLDSPNTREGDSRETRFESLTGDAINNLKTCNRPFCLLALAEPQGREDLRFTPMFLKFVVKVGKMLSL